MAAVFVHLCFILLFLPSSCPGPPQCKVWYTGAEDLVRKVLCPPPTGLQDHSRPSAPPVQWQQTGMCVCGPVHLKHCDSFLCFPSLLSAPSSLPSLFPPLPLSSPPSFPSFFNSSLVLSSLFLLLFLLQSRPLFLPSVFPFFLPLCSKTVRNFLQCC